MGLNAQVILSDSDDTTCARLSLHYQVYVCECFTVKGAVHKIQKHIFSPTW